MIQNWVCKVVGLSKIEMSGMTERRYGLLIVRLENLSEHSIKSHLHRMMNVANRETEKIRNTRKSLKKCNRNFIEDAHKQI